MALLLALHILMRKIHVLIVLHWTKAVIYFAALTLVIIAQSILMEAPFIRGLEGAPAIT